MAKTQYERQKESDARKGIVARGYKLPIAVIEQIAALAQARGKSQAAIITEAIALLASQEQK